jgi:hypothetical protein
MQRFGIALAAAVWMIGCGADGADKAAPTCSGAACAPTTNSASSDVGNAGPTESARNDDGIKNGTETDVDCGGKSGKRCAEGKACEADADCNGACSYTKKCIDTPSCKPHLGGDTCGTGEVGDGDAAHESCCKSLEVEGFEDSRNAGKKVYLDKYEVTAGRVRAFIEDITAKQGGKPNIKAWITANRPAWWNDDWTPFLPSDTEAEMVDLPHASEGTPVPTPANVGEFYTFGSVLYVYAHGNNCGNGEKSYGTPTYWYPPEVMEKNDGLARYFSQDELDVKAMTCIPNAVLAAFCHWDGGQLATDEVLDFVTDTKPSSFGLDGDAQCGCTDFNCTSRCPKLADVNATADSGGDPSDKYYYPEKESPEGSEGVQRIAPPGRVDTDRVTMADGDEPWADLVGNVHEMTLDSASGPEGGRFTLKYGGIGYMSSRAVGNTERFVYPEYKAGYSGGRCMRFR